jgi:hypothetical protein
LIAALLETENETKRKIETAEIPKLRRVSGYALTACVRGTTVRIALQIFDLEERIQDYKNKGRYIILRMDSSRLNPEFKNCQQRDEEILDDWEDDGTMFLIRNGLMKAFLKIHDHDKSVTLFRIQNYGCNANNL